ncbi:hypothetical protein NQ318_013414 [Aromia moschata]|uniref:Zinc finger protein 593 homolog n=1 Tax=Aromia moschata TaxID=1265417 RepID=A0AAV8YQ52_9CUCU|nr:hypothetical protein NQ318_013414 [Aromia moschata]
MVYKRRKYHYGDTHIKKKYRTKRRTKDLDQAIFVKSICGACCKNDAAPFSTRDEIDEDITPGNAKQLLNQDVDLDKPGGAQFYCLHCARYFINNTALQDHFKTKVHKRRLKALELEPYTIEESERAAGFGNWKAATKRKIETQSQSKESDSELDGPSKKMKIDDDM